MRTRHLHASFDVPGALQARGRVGGAPSWPMRTLFRRDLGGWPIFGDIAPERGGNGVPDGSGRLRGGRRRREDVAGGIPAQSARATLKIERVSTFLVRPIIRWILGSPCPIMPGLSEAH